MAGHRVATGRLPPLGRIFLCAAFAAACSDFPAAPEGEPDVEGWITFVRVQDSVTRLLVEEFPGRPAEGSTDPGAKMELVLDPVPDIVVLHPGGVRRRGDLFDLILGVRIRAWVGRVSESFPAVGDATFIEVVEPR